MMRSFMIIGGFTGFLLGQITGLASEAAWSTILWRSGVCAVAGGMLFRWWGYLWMNSLADAHRARQEASNNPTPRRASLTADSPTRE